MAVNQYPALRPSTTTPKTGKGARLEQTESRVKKNAQEKGKRDSERHHLERVSRLFKVADPRQTWTRTQVLSFGEMFYRRWILSITHQIRPSYRFPASWAKYLLAGLR